MIYVRLFTNPLTRIAQAMTQLQSMAAAGERVFEFLEEDQRLCGEWIAQAHVTKYALQHEPFVPFDLLGPGGAKTFEEFNSIVPDFFTRPHLLHIGSGRHGLPRRHSQPGHRFLCIIVPLLLHQH